jgi:hypothetical protein
MSLSQSFFLHSVQKSLTILSGLSKWPSKFLIERRLFSKHKEDRICNCVCASFFGGLNIIVRFPFCLLSCRPFGFLSFWGCPFFHFFSSPPPPPSSSSSMTHNQLQSNHSRYWNTCSCDISTSFSTGQEAD